MTKRKTGTTHKSRLPKYWAARTTEDMRFTIDESAWTRLQRILGAQLTSRDRETIAGIVEDYLDRTNFELNAPPVRDVLRSLDDLAQATRTLGILLVETESRQHPPAPMAALAAAGLEMREATQGHHTLGTLAEGLIAFFQGTQKAVADIESRTQEYWAVREGTGWISFIISLWDFSEARGWRPSASKGQALSRTASHSRFVEFVHELQQCFPERARRYATSKESLAKEIQLARKHSASGDDLTPLPDWLSS